MKGLSLEYSLMNSKVENEVYQDIVDLGESTEMRSHLTSCLEE
jgi:hypothetical protein